MLEFHSNLNPQLLIQLQMSNDDHEPYMLLCMHKIFHTEYILHPSTFPLHEVTSPHMCPLIRAAQIYPSNTKPLYQANVYCILLNIPGKYSLNITSLYSTWGSLLIFFGYQCNHYFVILTS